LLRSARLVTIQLVSFRAILQAIMISAHWYLRGRNAEESDRCGSAHIEERLLRIAAYTAHSSSGEGREPAIGFK